MSIPESYYDIRSAEGGDIEGIHAIHAYYVDNTVINFLHVPKRPDELLAQLRDLQAKGDPYLVAEQKGREIVGYSYVSEFRAKHGYQHTGELSLFVKKEWVGKGGSSHTVVFTRARPHRALQALSILDLSLASLA